jgi:hypothetical protein
MQDIKMKANNHAKRVLFILLFAAIAFLGNRINFSQLFGTSNQYFTLFQFFGPVAGSFLGPVFGSTAVLASEIFDFIIMGKAWSIFNLARLAPMIFAAYYFGAKNKYAQILIPIVSSAIFLLHPVGRQAWFFAIYWIIPIILLILPGRIGRHAFSRSLGSTFVAHSVGSAAFIWAVDTTPSHWIALIPIVATERLLFASGIYLTHKSINTVLSFLDERLDLRIPDNVLHIGGSRTVQAQ